MYICIYVYIYVNIMYFKSLIHMYVDTYSYIGIHVYAQIQIHVHMLFIIYTNMHISCNEVKARQRLWETGRHRVQGYGVHTSQRLDKTACIYDEYSLYARAPSTQRFPSQIRVLRSL